MTRQSALALIKLIIKHKHSLPTKGFNEDIGLEKDALYRALYNLEVIGMIELYGESYSNCDIKYYKKPLEELADTSDFHAALLRSARNCSGTYKTDLHKLSIESGQPVKDCIKTLFSMQGSGEMSIEMSNEVYFYRIV
jgi:hypothetical protein